MNSSLTLIHKANAQVYGDRDVITGVRIIQNTTHPTADGTFEEIARLGEDGGLERLPGFYVKQINRSTLLPGTIKAWHVHMCQDDVWFVPKESHLIAGLWDLRKGSKTENQTQRVVMGAGVARLLFIPRGVAHGVWNPTQRVQEMIYFVNKHFNPNDELRIAWDARDASLWMPDHA